MEGIFGEKVRTILNVPKTRKIDIYAKKHYFYLSGPVA